MRNQLEEKEAAISSLQKQLSTVQKEMDSTTLELEEKEVQIEQLRKGLERKKKEHEELLEEVKRQESVRSADGKEREKESADLKNALAQIEVSIGAPIMRLLYFASLSSCL